MAYTKVANPLILGSELLTNGMFSGNANSWTLGSNWAYSSANVLHTPGATADLKQSGVALSVSQASYRFVFSISGTAGSVSVKVTSSGTPQTVNAGVGLTVLTIQNGASGGDGTIYFTPTTDFDGAISAAGLRKVNTLYTKIGTGTY